MGAEEEGSWADSRPLCLGGCASPGLGGAGGDGAANLQQVGHWPSQ